LVADLVTLRNDGDLSGLGLGGDLVLQDVEELAVGEGALSVDLGALGRSGDLADLGSDVELSSVWQNVFSLVADEEAKKARELVPGNSFSLEYYLWVRREPTQKYQARLKKFAKRKRRSLFGLFVGDEGKKIYSIGTWMVGLKASTTVEPAEV
jgi:hypothetical protein